MESAEDTLALPIGEFNRRVVEDLVDDLRKIERDILRLAPDSALLPGYQAGFQAGLTEMKGRITVAMEDSTT